jgi:iron complex transport system substrate-binding protein
MNSFPQRIVCLSAEIADWLWRLGAWDCVVGVTAYFKEPAGLARRPRVSGFSTANLDEIIKLEPDLVITFSDVQAELAAVLLKRGFTVLATNQRTLAETEGTLALVARIVDRNVAGEKWLAEFHQRLTPVKTGGRRPRVYFEEWNEPCISGIAWVSEMIERAGGEEVFPELRSRRSALERVITVEQIQRVQPEIIFASWCGKPFSSDDIRNRRGWSEVPAVRSRSIFEIPGEDILQPGFQLVHGFDRMKQAIDKARSMQ